MTKEDRDDNAGLLQIPREDRTLFAQIKTICAKITTHLRGKLTPLSFSPSLQEKDKNNRKHYMLKVMIVAGIMIVVGIVRMRYREYEQ